MDTILDITYYLHSGFSCAIHNRLFVFDYWLGSQGEMREEYRITPNQLRKYDAVYVFVTHSHPDHYDPEIYTWMEESNVRYIISYELPEDCVGRRMKPGDEMNLEDDIKVEAFESTDLGVAFLLTVEGIHIFHAGDLNFWHWREESTAQEIEEADVAFKEAVAPIIGKPIDIAFFPVDTRQGRLYDAGANYFAMTVKPRLLIPMHFWGRNELIVEYTRRSRSRETEMIVMTRQGERMRIEFSPDGYMTIHILSEARRPQEKQTSTFTDRFDEEEDNPFTDSDLPVRFDED